MSSQDEIKSRKQNSLALMGEHGFELNDIIARALPYLRFDLSFNRPRVYDISSMGQIFLTLGGIVFHASIAPNSTQDPMPVPTDDLELMILNNFYTFYYGFSGFDT